MTAIGKVKEEVESQKSIDLEVLKQRLVRVSRLKIPFFRSPARFWDSCRKKRARLKN